MQLNILHTKELDEWLRERHYLRSTPAGAVIRMEFVLNGCRIGAMLWGRPTSPKLDQRKLLELTRMYFVDDAGHCVESKALAMARKHIRKHYPHVKGLIAYCSTAERHEGIVYQADGWFEIGRSRSNHASWQNRPNRTDRDLSIKIKFGRTP